RGLEPAHMVAGQAVARDALVVRGDRLAVLFQPLLAPAYTHLGVERLLERGGQIDVQPTGGLQQTLVDADVGGALAVGGELVADAHGSRSLWMRIDDAHPSPDKSTLPFPSLPFPSLPFPSPASG